MLRSSHLYIIAFILVLINAGVALLFGETGMGFALMFIMASVFIACLARMARTGSDFYVYNPYTPGDRGDAAGCTNLFGIFAIVFYIGMTFSVGSYWLLFAILGIPFLLSAIVLLVAARVYAKEKRGIF